MSGPTPIAATHRLTFPIFVGGFLHKHRVFVNAFLAGATWNLTGVTSNQPVSNCVNAYAVLLGPMYTTASATFNPVVLEAYSAGAYIPVASFTPATAPTSGTGYFPASQVTLVLRDSAYNMVRLVYMESVVGNPMHATTVGTMPGPYTNLCVALVAAPVTTGVSNWARSRAGLPLASFTSGTGTDNKRLRRDRGLI